MAAVEGLVKKRDAFETDLAVHRENRADVCRAGEKLISEENHYSDTIASRCQCLQSKIANLASLAAKRKSGLLDNSAYLQFMWKADVVESWIADHVRSEEFGRDLSTVGTLLTKQDTFDAVLMAFKHEGIANIRTLTEQLIQANHVQSVQTFNRDVNETKDWILETGKALSKDDLGKDYYLEINPWHIPLCAGGIKTNRIKIINGFPYFILMSKADLLKTSKPFQGQYALDLAEANRKRVAGACDPYDHNKHIARLQKENCIIHCCNFCRMVLGTVRETVYLHYRYKCNRLLQSHSVQRDPSGPARDDLDDDGVYMWQCQAYLNWLLKQDFVTSKPSTVIFPLDLILIWTAVCGTHLRMSDNTHYPGKEEHLRFEEELLAKVNADTVDEALIFTTFYKKTSRDSVDAQNKPLHFKSIGHFGRTNGLDHATMIRVFRVSKKGEPRKYVGEFYDSQTSVPNYEKLIRQGFLG